MKREIRLHNSPQQDILFPRLSLVLLDIFVVHVAFNALVPRDIKLLLNVVQVLKNGYVSVNKQKSSTPDMTGEGFINWKTDWLTNQLAFHLTVRLVYDSYVSPTDEVISWLVAYLKLVGRPSTSQLVGWCVDNAWVGGKKKPNAWVGGRPVN